MHIIDLRAIDKPIPLTHLTGRLFDGIIHQGQSATVNFAGGLIDGFSIAENSFAIPREIMVLPGGIDLHGGHGRDCYDILPGTKGDETHKEDSFTLALALAQGGATRGMCMPNLGRDVITEDQYNKQLAWINNPVDTTERTPWRIAVDLPGHSPRARMPPWTHHRGPGESEVPGDPEWLASHPPGRWRPKSVEKRCWDLAS